MDPKDRQKVITAEDNDYVSWLSQANLVGKTPCVAPIHVRDQSERKQKAIDARPAGMKRHVSGRQSHSGPPGAASD
jgi:hypothetical protein